MKKTIISLAGFGITLILILAAFMGPWYVITFKSPSPDINSEANMFVHLTGTKTEGKIPGLNLEGEAFFDYSDGGNIKTIADNVRNMLLAAIITTILALVFLLFSLLSNNRPNTFRMLGFCFGILTFLISIVSAIYFMSVSTEEGVDFWYTQTMPLFNITFGPGYAWYIMLIVAAASVIFSALLLTEEKTEIIKTEE